MVALLAINLIVRDSFGRMMLVVGVASYTVNTRSKKSEISARIMKNRRKKTVLSLFSPI